VTNQTAATQPSATTAAAQTQDVQGFTLEPPAAVAPLPVESSSGKVRLKIEDVVELDEQVRRFIEDLAAVDAEDPKFKQAIERVHTMGDRDIASSASVSNRMLERPMRSLQVGPLGDASAIGRSLVDLRRTVEELDPSKQGDLFAPRKLLGVIPFGNRVADYFARYQSAQGHLNAIIESLQRGKDELMRDNAA